ncbi:MAG: bifunctional aspartate kinase/diaminopimelate decarboxylase [Steroidobacteraceae bacterium]
MPTNASRWVVLKFGGTSVSSLSNWRNIAGIVRSRLASGARVLVVHSALAGITDRLEKLLEVALTGDAAQALTHIEERHRRLALELGIPVSAALERSFGELREIVATIQRIGAVSDRTRARLLAMGELMATELGASYLATQQIAVTLVDARRLLRAEERGTVSTRANTLSVTCGFAPDESLRGELEALTPVILTQGFIASDASGETVLLGRGGSDTSAAYLAAKLSATRLEIWTDVPGLFSANPRSTPTARLLRELHYDEAQEIATAGAKVLHPRCILPVRQYRIPLHVYATHTPDVEGTLLSETGGEGGAQVKAVCLKKGITLVSMESPGMWHQVGFLADAFQVFKDHSLSIDLVSTSETNVTISLDPQANAIDGDVLEDLVTDLSRLCRVQLIGPCASVSLVGRNIRSILHRLGDAFELFEEQKVYLVSQAANDLNFTFVVDEDQGDRLVDQLHELLVRPVPGDRVMGPTWEHLFGPRAPQPTGRGAWWQARRAALLAVLGQRDCAYVYDRDTVTRTAGAMAALKSVDRVFYAMKANPHPEILRAVYAVGLGIECVSRGEIDRALTSVPQIDRTRMLFTPNFAPRAEYAYALGIGLHVTIDNLFVLEQWPDLFKGRELSVRVDPGIGRGHHYHVRTAGAHSKFGVAVEDLERLARLAEAAGARIVGLHAHSGSGIFDIANWSHAATLLCGLRTLFRDARSIDVGGGLGVPDRLLKPAIDLAALDAAIAAARHADAGVQFFLEPGRYIVADAGVLLARVTQTKRKGNLNYLGVATGMNSLIRPALYGAYHEIFNLTRLGEPATELMNVVGPICESADVLGHDRLLPPTQAGDVLLIATAGAYGHAMASSYNLREPAEEILL